MARNQQTTPARLTAAQKRQKALQFRLAGYTYEQIAEVIGGSKQGAYKHVAKALATIDDDTRAYAEQVRQLEVARNERLLAAVWADALKGNLKAVERAMQLAKRITQVQGAEAPQKVAPTTPDGEHEAQGIVYLPPTAEDAEAWVQRHAPSQGDP